MERGDSGSSSRSVRVLAVGGEGPSLIVQPIHDFPASGSEPSHSTSGLVLVADGNFYGSAGGGATSSGTIYRMTPAGLVTSLFSFRYTNSAYPDGYSPGGLGIGKDGAIHGTTTAGGAKDSVPPKGSPHKE